MSTVTTGPDSVTPGTDPRAGSAGGKARASARRRAVLEECEFFAEHTMTGAEEMARKLGISTESLRLALMSKGRIHRPDLWHRLRDRDLFAGRVKYDSERAWDAAVARAADRMA
jgi:hypothetical protein